MTAEFEIESRWPELFERLSERERSAVVNTLASSWHEGWTPNREDIEILTDFVRGTIDASEYDRRAAELVELRKRSAATI